jgi:hypothetical protein
MNLMPAGIRNANGQANDGGKMKYLIHGKN